MTDTVTNNDNSTDMKHDLKTLKDYVRDDLYYAVKFIYDPAKSLEVDSKIYRNYFVNCKPRMGYGDAETTTRNNAARVHLQNVWNAGLVKKIQVKALSQKRSAVYTVMQNKFHGK